MCVRRIVPRNGGVRRAEVGGKAFGHAGAASKLAPATFKCRYRHCHAPRAGLPTRASGTFSLATAAHHRRHRRSRAPLPGRSTRAAGTPASRHRGFPPPSPARPGPASAPATPGTGTVLSLGRRGAAPLTARSTPVITARRCRRCGVFVPAAGLQYGARAGCIRRRRFRAPATRQSRFVLAAQASSTRHAKGGGLPGYCEEQARDGLRPPLRAGQRGLGGAAIPRQAADSFRRP